MRKLTLFTLILLGFLLSHSYSNGRNQSAFNLSLYNGDMFMVMFNYEVTVDASDEFDINNIDGGNYYLKVTRETIKVPAMADILFSGYIEIPAGCKIYAVIDESGKFLVYKKITDYQNYYSTGRHLCHCDCEACKNCIYKNKNIEWHEKEKENTDDCAYKSMKDKDFNDAVQVISSKAFESTKIDISKQILDNNTVTSEQVKQILQLFSFDDSKLEVAKYAYDKTCDKSNYYKVYDAFSFESSIQTLKNYITNRK